MQNVHRAALDCLENRDLEQKLALATALHADWRAGRLAVGTDDFPRGDLAGRPERPPLVAPSQLPRRGIGTAEGHAALIHAVAHIEFNAINLACDAVSRFQGMPEDYYADWIRVAAEEAYHFSLLQKRLHDLGHTYGDFPAHDGLWDLARKTAHDVLLRMVLVPRVMEARGLDVTPGMVERFRQVGDQQTVEALEIILRDEVGHVAAGSRWFHHVCAQRGLDAEETYFDILREHFNNGIRCPLHTDARRRAGFSESELGRLEALCKS